MASEFSLAELVHADGHILRVNRKAVELWGQSPRRRDPTQRFCGSFRVESLDGRFIPPDQTPMALSVLQGASFEGIEAVVVNPDGRRAKYGALSALGRPGERRLDRRGAVLRLQWREAGGPPVAPPERRGFGTRLLEDNLFRELGGQTSLAYRPEGVGYDIVAPC